MFEWDNKLVEFNHIGVKFKYKDIWYYHDSTKTVPEIRTNRSNKKAKFKSFNNMLIIPADFEVVSIKHIAKKREGWNTYFDRKKYIPVLKKKMKELIL